MWLRGLICICAVLSPIVHFYMTGSPKERQYSPQREPFPCQNASYRTPFNCKCFFLAFLIMFFLICEIFKIHSSIYFLFCLLEPCVFLSLKPIDLTIFKLILNTFKGRKYSQLYFLARIKGLQNRLKNMSWRDVRDKLRDVFWGFFSW